VVGGVQLCTVLEQTSFETRGVTYLQFHPIVPSPSLLPPESARQYVMGAILDGTALGPCRSSDVEAALLTLRRRTPAVSIDVVIHAMLGHGPDFVADLCRALGIDSVCYWVHDYYSICPMHALLRNNAFFCHAPAEDSAACAMCIHGEPRKAHRASFKRLFDALAPVVVAPSQTALGFWCDRSGLAARRHLVHPHATVAPAGVKAPRSDGPLRVAFLGLPRYHKGWQIFSQLVMSLREDSRYRFYVLGSEPVDHPAIEWREVTSGPANPRAMTDALCREAVDAVVHWSSCYETFGLTALEALAAGAFVVTRRGTGHVAAMVAGGAAGVVLDDAEALFELFTSGSIVSRVDRAISDGMTVGTLSFSGLSADFLAPGGKA
jgi:glycosyltransferase involved in cell wall biosynthesis